jgi:hypothetical protein
MITYYGTTSGWKKNMKVWNKLPCYEQKRSQVNNPTWNPAGQEDNFAKRRTLLLATTQFNSTQWSTQLSATAGVVKVEAPFDLQCP